MRVEILGKSRLLEHTISNVLAGWRQLTEKVKTFFTGDFKSGWQKKTGLPWNEWQKWEGRRKEP